MTDAIERTLELEAAPNRVWKALTDANEIASWFGDSAELDPRLGSEGWFGWESYGRAAVRIEEHNEAAVDPKLIEDQIHDFFEHWIEFLDLKEDFRHLGKNLEDPFAGTYLLGNLLWLTFESVVLVKLRQRSQKSGR